MVEYAFWWPVTIGVGCIVWGVVVAVNGRLSTHSEHHYSPKPDYVIGGLGAAAGLGVIVLAVTTSL